MGEPLKLDLSLPYITPEVPGIGGEIKSRPEHFVVEEIPLYEPSGEGDHLYVSITRAGATTRDIQLGLAALFGLRPEDVGKAGLKDKNAVATQTFSVNLQGACVGAEEARRLIEDSLGVHVNWARYHGHKLRAGHLRGNRFTVTVTNLDAPVSRALELIGLISDRLNLRGLPNYYGEQRTGKAGDNIRSGWEVLQGRKRVLDRWLRRFLISSYQSHLCNRYLAERVSRGLFGRLLIGDVAKKHDTGGLFIVESMMEQPRYEAGEISFTAPMVGYKMMRPKGEAAALEDEILSPQGFTDDQLRRCKAKGARRIGRVFPQVSFAEAAEGVRLVFTLPTGSYATTLLREFMKSDQPDAPGIDAAL